MFNLGWGEVVVLAVVAFLVLGPERLPRYAAEAARVLKNLRRMADDARTELNAELGTEITDLRKLNPKRALREHLLGDDDDVLGLRDEPLGPPVPTPLRSGERPPYDPDAT